MEVGRKTSGVAGKKKNLPKWRWEIDPKTNEVVRVRADEMHYEAWEDFKKVLVLGAEKMGLGLPGLDDTSELTPRQRAKWRTNQAALKRRARRARKRRRKVKNTRDCDAGLAPRERVRRRRARLSKAVNTELRKCTNTAKLMTAFPPVFNKQCDGLSDGLGKLGTVFKDASHQVASLEEKIERKRVKMEAMRQEYKQVQKRARRLMFEKLASKAKRVLARRRRVKAQKARAAEEQRRRSRSPGRYDRATKHDTYEDDLLEQLAQTEAHASIAMLLNDHLNAAAPPRTKTHIEHKLRIGDCINAFLAPEKTVVADAARDIIQAGVKEFRRANIQLIGGKVGEKNVFDEQFGTAFDDDEFVGYNEEDLADMTPEQQTRYFAWQRSQQKKAEMEIFEKFLDLDAVETTEVEDKSEWMKSDSDEEMDDLFATLLE